MKKILVPTDFSDTSKNAARYAVKLASADPGSLIVLYNVFDPFAAGSDGSLLTETDDDRKAVLNQALAQLEIELHELSDVKIEYLAESGRSLVENIEKYVRHKDIDFVIIGITGTSRFEQIFIGSNTLNLAKEGVCPVMIVPPDAQFIKIEKVLLASDFKHVEESTPVAQIKTVLSIFNPEMHIINIDAVSNVELTTEYQSEQQWLEQKFAAYRPQSHFLRSDDFAESINSYVNENKIDLIVTIAKNHTFFEGLFKSSHTKTLAYRSHVPILVAHE